MAEANNEEAIINAAFEATFDAAIVVAFGIAARFFLKRMCIAISLPLFLFD